LALVGIISAFGLVIYIGERSGISRIIGLCISTTYGTIRRLIEILRLRNIRDLGSLVASWLYLMIRGKEDKLEKFLKDFFDSGNPFH
jgi:hypothetical protein